MRVFGGCCLTAAALAVMPGAARADTLTITATTDAAALVSTILGPGITIVGAPALSGAPSQQGTFTGGTSTVGFDSGIVLSTGDVRTFGGANTTGVETLGVGDETDDLSTSWGRAGDPDLTALVGGLPTFDADVLTLDFQFGDGSTGGDLFLNFVFASDEYIDWVDTGFNDALGFFVDDANFAFVDGLPVTINTVNPLLESDKYVNNVPNTNGFPVAGRPFQFDGLTTVLTARMLGLGPGAHTLKLAIADGGDTQLDSAVFVRAGSLTSEPPVGVPEPGTLVLLTAALVAFGSRSVADGIRAVRRRRSGRI